MQTMFTLPTLVYFGRGVSRQLVPLLENQEAKRIFLVSDPGVRTAGLLDAPLNGLQEAGLQVRLFAEVLPNAPDFQVDAAAEQARDFGADAFVSIGGGSSMDTAKAANILLANPGPLRRYDGLNLVPKPGLPHIAIPTTAGTSSELTVAAVISDEKNKKKMVFFGRNVAASIALIDPELTYGLPPALTASTGMDALTHAMEAYISTAASPVTDALAPEAIALIAAGLPLAYRNGADTEARDKIMLGCQLAGCCFSNTGLGIVHSMAHPMGAHCHVPHGLANAICLAVGMRYSMSRVPGHKIRRMAEALGLKTENRGEEVLGPAICSTLKTLTETLRIPTIAQAGVTKDKIPVMAEDSLKELSTVTTPRQPTAGEVAALYRELFAHAGQ
ncbi:MAG: iron-containing alcohol dehydrogenase [Desulfovibrio sp.]|jgi:alcohol dehydrogenase class IV|nr:iron-containing alcohol dehydrogenase [Desulfovibrio sp.]